MRIEKLVIFPYGALDYKLSFPASIRIDFPLCLSAFIPGGSLRRNARVEGGQLVGGRLGDGEIFGGEEFFENCSGPAGEAADLVRESGAESVAFASRPGLPGSFVSFPRFLEPIRRESSRGVFQELFGQGVLVDLAPGFLEPRLLFATGPGHRLPDIELSLRGIVEAGVCGGEQA